MPKLVQINVSLNKGSTGRIAEWIADTASRRGWECYMVHGARYVNASKYSAIQVSSLWEERFHYLKSLLFDAQGLGSKWATRRLIRRLKEMHPDVVHLHNIHGSYINYPLLFRYFADENIRVVWTLHDCWSITGHCAYFDAIDCKRWQTGCGYCPQKKKFPRTLIFDKSRRNWEQKKRLFNNVENLTVAPVSGWLASFVQRSYLGSVRTEVVHNGIDLSIFRPVTNDIHAKYKAEGKLILLGVADGFGERKGLQDFVALSEIFGDEVQIILIGVEDGKLGQIPSQIVALSRTNSQAELVEYYSAADIFLNPTYEDNFPTTNLEALACGTPVITYDTGGSPEAIDERTGIVVEKGNVNAFAEAIRKMKAAPIDGAVCRRRAEELFDKDKCFEKYLRLYADCKARS